MNITTSELAKFSNFCRDNNFHIPIESTEIFLKYRTSKRISSLEENLKYLFYLVQKDKETKNTFKNLIYRYFNLSFENSNHEAFHIIKEYFDIDDYLLNTLN